MEILSPLVSIGISFIILILSIVYFVVRDASVPPGPVGLPYFGYWPFMNNNNCHLKLHALRKKYGEIFSFMSTGRLYMNLGSIKAVREALINKSECFGERIMDYNLMTSLFQDGKYKASYAFC